MTVPKQNLKLQYDGDIAFAFGRSRKELNWKNDQMLWSKLASRLGDTVRTRETYKEYGLLPKAEQDDIKDVGGFVGGTLKGGRRKTDAVVWRQIVTLDADYATSDFFSMVEMLLGCACVVYSTHKHSPDSPRLRLVIPLSRPVSPDEYQAVSRRIAADTDIDFFDDTTYQPHRLMYWPSTSSDGVFFFETIDAPWLDPDKVLSRYSDWRDQSFWPESSRTHKVRENLAKKQGDPVAKKGVVGAFCRTYAIPEAIENFLVEVYAPCGENRYTYLPGSSAGGLVLYQDGLFAYSHHGTDPISGMLVNAFDLVRLHLFGDLDDDEKAIRLTPTKLPSYKAMQDFALEDDAVKVSLGEERVANAQIDFDDMDIVMSEDYDKNWMAQLETNRRNELEPTISNLLLILEHDPHLAAAFSLNEFSHRAAIRKPVPWRKEVSAIDGELWVDNDDAALRYYVEGVYKISAPAKLKDAVSIVLDRHKFHPIQDYLSGLEWDKRPRLDTLFIDCFNADNSEYVRAVTRKTFAAAVARVFIPGIKFDYVLVSIGDQGLGKSHIIDRLAGRWFSNSLDALRGKDAYEQLQGAWIIELGELSAIRKVDVEAVKHFISKREDYFRVPYGVHPQRFPRQCIFVGTTNDPIFLRDQTGNRRFWPIKLPLLAGKKGLRDVFALDQHYFDQFWAEATHVWQQGEKLYLDAELSKSAIEIQGTHTEESDKAGIIRDYLDKLFPDDWDNRTLIERRTYLHNRDFGEPLVGTVVKERVCAMEIWVELFEEDPKTLTLAGAREINGVIQNTRYWSRYGGKTGKLRFKDYGLQRCFVRRGVWNA